MTGASSTQSSPSRSLGKEKSLRFLAGCCFSTKDSDTHSIHQGAEWSYFGGTYKQSAGFTTPVWLSNKPEASSISKASNEVGVWGLRRTTFYDILRTDLQISVKIQWTIDSKTSGFSFENHNVKSQKKCKLFTIRVALNDASLKLLLISPYKSMQTGNS